MSDQKPQQPLSVPEILLRAPTPTPSSLHPEEGVLAPPPWSPPEQQQQQLRDKFMFCMDNRTQQQQWEFGGSDFNLSTLISSPLLGRVIDGAVTGSTLGRSVSTAGDFNADGLSDVLIGAPNWNSNQGKAFVVFGKSKESSNHTLVPEQPEFQMHHHKEEQMQEEHGLCLEGTRRGNGQE